MRSISIVYKTHKRQSSSHLLLTRNANNMPRRSMEEYQNRLLEKERNKDRVGSQKHETLQRLKSRTSNQTRKKDKFQIIGALGTLNIASLPLHEQQLTEEKKEKESYKTQHKIYITRKMSSKRPPTLFGLNMTPLQGFEEQPESTGKWVSSKLQCMYRPKIYEPKDTILALSVNFILNEHYFWGNEQLDETACKHWKMLQNYSNIAWICQKSASVQKLLKFSKTNNLRLDAVYLILPKKNKRTITVNYSPIQSDFNIKNLEKVSTPLLSKQQKKLVIINGLLVDSVDDLQAESFYNMVPIIKNPRSVVHYAKIDFSDGSRFSSVVKILSQEVMPSPFNIMPILRQFSSHQEEKQRVQCSCDLTGFDPIEKDLLCDLEAMKIKFLKYFTRNMPTLPDKLSENPSSVQFIIGDAIRRNYKIFENYLEFDEEHQLYRYHQKIHQGEGRLSPLRRRRGSPSRYRNNSYLWKL